MNPGVRREDTRRFLNYSEQERIEKAGRSEGVGRQKLKGKIQEGSELRRSWDDYQVIMR